MQKAVLLCDTYKAGRDHLSEHFRLIGPYGQNGTFIVREHDKPNMEPFEIRLASDENRLRGHRFIAIYSITTSKYLVDIAIAMLRVSFPNISKPNYGGRL